MDLRFAVIQSIISSDDGSSRACLQRKLTCAIKPGPYDELVDRVSIDDMGEARCIEVARLRIDGDTLQVDVGAHGREAYVAKPVTSKRAGLLTASRVIAYHCSLTICKKSRWYTIS